MNKCFHKTFFFICIIIHILLFSCSSYAGTNLLFEIHGIQGDALTNAQNRLISIARSNQPLNSNQKIHNLYINGRKEVIKGIEPFGYFHARVITSKLVINKGVWTAIYYINPGELLRIRNINISVSGDGRNNDEIQKYISKIPLKPNDVFNVPNYNDVITTLFDIAKNQGYLKAFYKNDILVDLRRNICDITIHLETGPQYYFGHLWFETHPYSLEFMNRFFSLQPGEVFSSNKILILQQDMSRSYYFKHAMLKPDFNNTNAAREVPIRAYLYPPPPYSYKFGVGYGTLTGVRLSGAMSFRRIGNEGHHLETELKLSSFLSAIATTYYMPGKNPLTDEWLVGANFKRFIPNAGESNSATLTGGFSKKTRHWQMSETLNFLVDRFSINQSHTMVSHELYPSWIFNYVDADNLQIPRNGFHFHVAVDGAAKPLLSTTSYARMDMRFKSIYTPFSFARLLFRTELGYMTVHNLPVFPMSLQFFAGGIGSIRGFAEDSIGPGKYLGIASLEYQNRIYGNLFGAIFYDAGYATNKFTNFLNRGAGIGLVYDTQIGPIKFYVSKALSKHTQPRSIEISIGPEFG